MARFADLWAAPLRTDKWDAPLRHDGALDARFLVHAHARHHTAMGDFLVALTEESP